MHPHSPRRHSPRGFSLIEMMVGIVVGLIGLLVIYKTLSVWDNHTRTTIAGGDAQTSGTLAMFNLERDLKLAGMGIGVAPLAVMGCSVVASDTQTGRVLTPFPLYPVQIVPGDSDQINVFWGTSSFAVTAQSYTNATATTKKMAKRDGLLAGDVVLVTGNGTATPGSADCQLAQITDNTLADLFSVAHSGTALVTAGASYPANSVTAARYNPAGGTGATFTSGTLFDLGPTPAYAQWKITGGHSLTRTNLLQGPDALEIADGVVAIKAEYGYDTNGDNVVGNTEWLTALPANADWTKVRAIRVALLVRSDQFEKPETTSASGVPVTPVAPTWSHGNPASAPTAFVMKNVNGSADSYSGADVDPQNWRYYRYRTYEKVIPLRNMIWGTAP